jgi:hypothetical protein
MLSWVLMPIRDRMISVCDHRCCRRGRGTLSDPACRHPTALRDEEPPDMTRFLTVLLGVALDLPVARSYAYPLPPNTQNNGLVVHDVCPLPVGSLGLSRSLRHQQASRVGDPSMPPRVVSRVFCHPI